MDPHQMNGTRAAQPAAINPLLGVMSFVTMVMTVPQVWVIWVEQEAAGVSLLSWGTYFVSALLWFVHGLQQRNKNIYLACIGWMVLDVAVIVGVAVHR